MVSSQDLDDLRAGHHPAAQNTVALTTGAAFVAAFVAAYNAAGISTLVSARL